VTFNGKIVLALNTSTHHKDVWKSGRTAPSILNLGINGGEWRVSRSGRYILEKKAPFTKCMKYEWTQEEVWTMWRRGMNFLSVPEIEVFPLIIHASLFTILTELSWLPYTSSLVTKPECKLAKKISERHIHNQNL
jgi:hypothetical protein